MQFTFNEGHIQLPSQWQDQSMQVLVSTDNSGINLVINPYHAQYILRRRDDYLELFDRDALSSRFFYDAFPGMRLRHPVTDDTSDDRLAHSPADRMYMLGGMSDTASNRITFERDSQ